jgi:catechol 2,3-dioxygenase-like lactoylglutathione lyase family enzyme
MTQILGHIPSQKRAGELGVHSLDHFCMSIPDGNVAENFYDAFGLNLKVKDSKLELFAHDNPHRWGILMEGTEKALQYISFAAYEEDYEPLRKKIEQNGVKLLDPPKGFESRGFWFRDPDGILVEIRIAEKSSPNVKSPFENPSVLGGERGAAFRSKVHKARPKRLAHILMFTSDVLRQIDFYKRTLGLRLSDHSGDGIAFMHGIHGSDHHLIALAKSSAPGLHHCSWDVGSINDVGIGAMQMHDKGFQKGWGMGRHVLGSNYFHYVRDPWGSYSEYSADIDYVPVDCDWQCGDHDPADSFYLWGPDLPEDFVHNYESSVLRKV